MSRDHHPLLRQVGAVTHYPGVSIRHQQAVLFALALFAAASANAAAFADASFQPISMAKLSQVQGDYQLSNGHRVTLAESNGRLYAVLGKRDRRELLATGEHTFSTRDGSLKLQFQPQAEGDQVVLTDSGSAADRDRSLARVFQEAQRNKHASLPAQGGR